MGSNVNRLEMLSVIDDLHEKYKFTDGEYKKMVETLSGKNEPLDVSTATVVKSRGCPTN